MEQMKSARKEKNISQSKLADMVGVSEKMIFLTEANKRRPSVDLAKKIAKVLDFDWTLFFED